MQIKLIDAYLRNDLTALDCILADEYTFTDDRGMVLTKKEILDSFKSGARRITSYQVSDDKVRVHGNAALMTYRYRSKETYKGQDESGDYRITRIFVRKNSRWQVVAGHETRISVRDSSDIDDVSSRLMAMERTWTDAAVRGDTATVNSMITDGFVMTTSDGTILTKAQREEAYRSARRKWESAKIDDMKVYLYGDTAVVTGRWTGKGTFNGKPMAEVERWTDIWIRQNGIWKCVASQSTPTPAR